MSDASINGGFRRAENEILKGKLMSKLSRYTREQRYILYEALEEITRQELDEMIKRLNKEIGEI